MRIVLYILLLIATNNLFGQEKNFELRLYISPNITATRTLHRVFKDGNVYSAHLTKSKRIFFSGGVEFLRNISPTLLLGSNLGLITKGYFAVSDTNYFQEVQIGTSFERVDLHYLEPTLFVEKQVILNDNKSKILLTAGLFYGIHIAEPVQTDLDANDNDFGVAFSLGLKHKFLYIKVDFRRGLTEIHNKTTTTFRTAGLNFNIGCSIL